MSKFVFKHWDIACSKSLTIGEIFGSFFSTIVCLGARLKKNSAFWLQEYCFKYSSALFISLP